MTHDLGPAAARIADLVRAVDADRLGDPTPCAEYAVGDLLDHISSLAVGLAGAARKEGGAPPPAGDAARLADDWRTTIPAQVEALAAAWREPGALEGVLDVGGFEMPAQGAFMVANEELVLHGWDLAKAIGRPFAATDGDLDVVRSFFEAFGPEQRGAGYAPSVEAPDAASQLDRLVALSGRQPNWPAA